MKFAKELDVALYAAKEASKIILDFYNHGFKVEIKEDDSPVTDADKTADKKIREILSEHFPTYTFLTEESVDDKSRLENDYVWVIDPLDGTKDFVARDDQFTCNIALVYKHKAVLGIVAIPVRNEYYYAVEGKGAFVIREGKTIKLSVSKKTNDITCLRSVFHFTSEEEKIIALNSEKITRVEKAGSSIKACLIAEGLAEISLRLTDYTKEWDTAAFQIVVEEAGGYVLKFDKTPIFYNRDDVYNRGGFVIINNLENFPKVK